MVLRQKGEAVFFRSRGSEHLLIQKKDRGMLMYKTS